MNQIESAVSADATERYDGWTTVEVDGGSRFESRYPDNAVRGKLIRLWGPPGLKAFVDALRPFAKLRRLDLQVTEVTSRVTITLGKTRDNQPPAAVLHLLLCSSEKRPQPDRELALWGICADSPGKLDGARLRQLGVVGPLCGQLKRGEDVVLPDGRELRACDFLTGGGRGAQFVVLTNRSVELPALRSDTSRKRPRDDVEFDASLVSHVFLLGPRHPQPDVFTSATIVGQNAPGEFPICRDGERLQALVSSVLPQFMRPPRRVVPGTCDDKPLRTITFLPHYSFSEGTFDVTVPESPVKAQPVATVVEQPRFPAVTVLGSGSAVPGKYRNVSSYLLELDESKALLFDCGEGTLGQICRATSGDDSFDENSGFRKETMRVLKAITHVFISHAHADHHIGLLGLLEARRALGAPALWIIIPRSLSLWLQHLSHDFGFHFHTFVAGRNTLDDEDSVGMSLEVGDSTHVNFVEVLHTMHLGSVDSFAFVVHRDSEPLFAYSGDCRPTSNLVKACRGVALLTHEATFPVGMEEEAAAKNHSTIKEAIE